MLKIMFSEYGICLPKLKDMQFEMFFLSIPIIQIIIFGFFPITIKEVILIIIFAFVEEFAFRVLLIKILNAWFKMSIVGDTLTSSLIFAIFHGLNINIGITGKILLMQSVYAFCAGCAFCIFFIKTKSIFPSFVLHALLNLTSVKIVKNKIDLIIIITIVFSAIFMIYSIVAIIKMRKGIFVNETLY